MGLVDIGNIRWKREYIANNARNCRKKCIVNCKLSESHAHIFTPTNLI